MSSHNPTIPPPAAFGLPEKFAVWRANQDVAITQTIDNQKRYTAHVCPTGFGKSLTYIAIALLSGKRALILTSTKGLQTQLLTDFSGIGLVDIRGRNSYRCLFVNDRSTNCDAGPCVLGMKCPLRDSGCLYYDRLKEAGRANLVVTNYAYWMTSNKYGGGIGKFDIIVCDEAHDTPDIVASFLTITMDRKKGYTAGIIPEGDLTGYTVGDWRSWAKDVMPDVLMELRGMEASAHGGMSANAARKYVRMKALSEDLKTIRDDLDDKWVVRSNTEELVFAPVWPAPYVERTLFLGTKMVVLTSATVNMKTVNMLGVSNEEILMLEFPHSFPLDHRRLIHIPTVRMNYRCTEAQLKLWVRRIDQIITNRLDRKGVVHTVSYKRRDLVLANSQYERHMITHRRLNTESQVKKFKASAAPSILVSPSMATGWDFPYKECEYQVVGKIAYPDTRDKIVEARSKSDRDYTSYVAMQQLVQACGRGVRAADDRCETFVIDDNITWFMYKYKKFAPRWFWDTYINAKVIPQPPAALKKGGNNAGL
jgi:Rad3-related DNA helicase